MKDEVFFERIEKIRKKMYAIAYSYFYSESVAIDVTDEAVYKAYIKKKTLKNEEFLETWVIRILMNLCCDKHKKYAKQCGIEAVSESELADSFSFENLELKDAINHLPEELRKMIVLKYFVGYSTEELAKVLDIPMGTVGTRIRKALKLLKIDLEV